MVQHLALGIGISSRWYCLYSFSDTVKILINNDNGFGLGARIGLVIDGINDVPALSGALVGITMLRGADSTIAILLNALLGRKTIIAKSSV